MSTEKDAWIDVIEEDGLSSLRSRDTFRLQQLMSADRHPQYLEGNINLASLPPKPPQSYLNQLQDDWVRLQRTWKYVMQENIDKQPKMEE